MPTIIIGMIFFAIVAYGAYRWMESLKSGSCPGCSGGCSASQRNSCSAKSQQVSTGKNPKKAA